MNWHKQLFRKFWLEHAVGASFCGPFSEPFVYIPTKICPILHVEVELRFCCLSHDDHNQGFIQHTKGWR